MLPKILTRNVILDLPLVSFALSENAGEIFKLRSEISLNKHTEPVDTKAIWERARSLQGCIPVKCSFSELETLEIDVSSKVVKIENSTEVNWTLIEDFLNKYTHVILDISACFGIKKGFPKEWKDQKDVLSRFDVISRIIVLNEEDIEDEIDDCWYQWFGLEIGKYCKILQDIHASYYFYISISDEDAVLIKNFFK